MLFNTFLADVMKPRTTGCKIAFRSGPSLLYRTHGMPLRVPVETFPTSTSRQSPPVKAHKGAGLGLSRWSVHPPRSLRLDLTWAGSQPCLTSSLVRSTHSTTTYLTHTRPPNPGADVSCIVRHKAIITMTPGSHAFIAPKR